MMNRKVPVTIVLLSFGAGALQAATRVAAPTPSNRKPHVETVKAPQVKGALTWSSNYGAKPSAGDDCSHFNVTVLEQGASAPPSGGIDVGSPGKDIGHFKAMGKITSGECHYMIGGVATDKPIKISVGYFGPMAEKADSKRASSEAFTLEPGKTLQKDLKLTLTQVK
jgi:hypothetical protein